jgi:diaminopimelate decarboxylase
VIGPDIYAEAVQPYLDRLGCDLILEPGRYIAGNSGILLTRVTYRKVTEHGKKFLICDAGMNDMLRPTLYEAFHGIWPTESEGGMPEELSPEAEEYEGIETETVDVVGPVCESGDYLGKDVAVPRVEQGGLLSVFSAGAYGFTMASNYNARPRPPEIMVEGDEDRLVRPRETYEDLVAPETDLI